MNTYFTADRRTFFRTLGSGPPLVLLHASPSSSLMMVPLARMLADRYTVVAPDTPGYGKSAPLPLASTDPPVMSDYAEWLGNFLAALGVTRCALYVTATGAQLAIRYALTHPEYVHQLYLDNAAHFTDDQRSEILRDYFPDISPAYDGSHLLTVWTLVRDLFTFFPWCHARPENRLQISRRNITPRGVGLPNGGCALPLGVPGSF